LITKTKHFLGRGCAGRGNSALRPLHWSPHISQHGYACASCCTSWNDASVAALLIAVGLATTRTRHERANDACSYKLQCSVQSSVWQRITFKTAVVLYNPTNMHAQTGPGAWGTYSTSNERGPLGMPGGAIYLTDYWIQTSFDGGCRRWRIALQCYAFSQESALVGCSDTWHEHTVTATPCMM